MRSAGTMLTQLHLQAAKLTEKEKDWEGKMAPYAGTKVVTFHDSWPNFVKHFKLTVAGHVEPKPGIPPSPSHPIR